MVVFSLPLHRNTSPPRFIVWNHSHLCYFCLETNKVNHLLTQVTKEAQRQLITDITCTYIHIKALSQRKTQLMSGLQQGGVFSPTEAINLAFPAGWDCYVLLRGKSVLSFWSCNNITEHMLCNMANYPLFPPLNATVFIHARKQI